MGANSTLQIEFTKTDGGDLLFLFRQGETDNQKRLAADLACLLSRLGFTSCSVPTGSYLFVTKDISTAFTTWLILVAMVEGS